MHYAQNYAGIMKIEPITPLDIFYNFLSQSYCTFRGGFKCHNQ